MIDKGKFTHTYISYYTFLLFFLFIASELSWNTMKFSLFFPARRRSLMCVAFPKCLISFCRGREHKTTIFFFFSWTLIQSFRIPLQRNLPTFNEWSEIVWGSENSQWRFRSRRRRRCSSSQTSQLLELYGWIDSLCCMYLLDSCVVLHKYLRSQRFNLWVLLETNSPMRLTLHMCHGCVFSGYVLDYHALYLQHFMSIERIEISYRAFPKRVGPRILSLESFDYFGTISYFRGRKKEQSQSSWAKLRGLLENEDGR